MPQIKLAQPETTREVVGEIIKTIKEGSDEAKRFIQWYEREMEPRLDRMHKLMDDINENNRVALHALRDSRDK